MKEKVFFATSFVPALIIVYRIAYEAFGGSVSAFNYLVLALLLLFPLFMSELNLRTIRIDEEMLKGAAPLGLYRQVLRLEEIEGIRLNSTGRGSVAEIFVRGRWIVLFSNENFRRHVHNPA
jgi:hypothetical protein